MAPSNTTPNDALEPTDIQESALNHPGGQTGDESVSANPISNQELSEISEDNIIDEERSAKPTSFKGDDELDAKVDEVAQNDEGMA